MICTTCFLTDPVCRTCGGTGWISDPPDPSRGVSRDVRLFGTEAFPLHASALPGMVQCPWKAALVYLFEPEDGSSEAADTGSATHVAVAEWHRKKDHVAAIEAMRESAPRFPLADFDQAATMFLLYSRDPRNKEAEIAQDEHGHIIERKISFTITPAPEDITQAPISVIGTLDQVRIVHGRPRVYDLKTSKRPGLDLMNAYLYQIAAYALGASSVLRKPVSMGGLITPRHYKGAPELCPSGVFWEYAHRFDDIHPILDGIRRVVASIRAGNVYINPGDYCRYCVAGGTDQCLPMLRSAVDPGTHRIHLRQVHATPAT